MLRHSGVTRRLTLPVSAGLLTNTGAYFDALGSYREGDPALIVRQFCAAFFAGVDNGRRLVKDLTGIYAAWQRDLPSREGSAARRILPHLLSQPAVTVKHIQQHLSVSQPAAQRAVDQLVEAAILHQVSTDKRDRMWIARDVIEALRAQRAVGPPVDTDPLASCISLVYHSADRSAARSEAGAVRRLAGRPQGRRIHAARQRAALAVNTELLRLYWQIGRDILDRPAPAGLGQQGRRASGA